MIFIGVLIFYTSQAEITIIQIGLTKLRESWEIRLPMKKKNMTFLLDVTEKSREKPPAVQGPKVLILPCIERPG